MRGSRVVTQDCLTSPAEHAGLQLAGKAPREHKKHSCHLLADGFTPIADAQLCSGSSGPKDGLLLCTCYCQAPIRGLQGLASTFIDIRLLVCDRIGAAATMLRKGPLFISAWVDVLNNHQHQAAGAMCSHRWSIQKGFIPLPKSVNPERQVGRKGATRLNL
jgi:hypothetical protein